MGFSFDAYYMKADDDFTAGLKMLTREMRDYVTDMVQEISQKDPVKG